MNPIAERWTKHWDQCSARTPMGGRTSLDDALLSFLDEELGRADRTVEPPVVIGMALSGITTAKTHTRMAIEASMQRLFPSYPQKRSSPMARLARRWVAASAVWAASVGTYFAIWGNHFNRDAASQALMLAVLPPLLWGFAVIAWRWAKR